MRYKPGFLTFLALFAIAGPTGSAMAANGPVDPAFGTGGFTTSNASTFPVEAGASSHMVRDDAGSTYSLQRSASSHIFDRTFRRIQLIKTGPDGTPDESFGEGGYRTVPLISETMSSPAGLALQGDSLIGVTIGDGETDGIAYLRRWDASTGDLDKTFGAEGLASFKFGSSQPSGGGWFYVTGTDVDSSRRIYVSGYTAQRRIVFRLTPNGILDRTFGDAGITEIDGSDCPSGLIGSALVNDSLYVATEECVLHLTTSGAVDSGYQGDQLSGSGVIVAIESSPDGDIYLTSGNGVQTKALLKLDSDGSFDETFGTEGQVELEPGQWGYAFAIDASGRFIFSGVGLDTGSAVLRLDPAGNPDPTFGTNGIASYHFAFGVNSMFEGVLVTGGAGQPLATGNILRNGSGYQYLVRFLEDGSLDPSWNGDGVAIATSLIAPTDRIFDTATIPAGGILAAGKSGYKAAFARYKSNGRLDRTYGNRGWLRFDTGRGVWDDEVRNLTLLKGGDAVACIETNPGVSIVRVTPSGHLDSDFGNGGLLEVSELARCVGVSPLPNDRFLLAAAKKVGSSPPWNRTRGVIIRFNGDGSVDHSYGTDGTVSGPLGNGRPPPFSYKGLPDGGGLLATYGSIIKFGPDGQRDRSFGNGGTRKFRNARGEFRILRPGPLAITPNGSILIATRFEGRISVAKLTASGGLVRKFGTRKGWSAIPKEKDSRVHVTDMRLQPNGRIVITAYAQVDCFAFLCESGLLVYRLTRSGIPDPGFSGDGIFERRFGISAGASSVSMTKRGPVVGGWADTAAGTNDFLLIGFRPS